MSQTIKGGGGRRKGRRKTRKRRRCRGRSHYQEMAQTHEEETKNALRDFGWVASNANFFLSKVKFSTFPYLVSSKL